MKPSRIPLFAAAVSLLAACGGQTADPAFVDAAPSYGALAMDQTTPDGVAPATGAATAALAAAPADAAATMAPESCHPHLFVRTHEVVARVNRHLLKFLAHVEAAIARHPLIADATEHVWQYVRKDGVQVRFTITRTDATSFTWLLELAPPGGAFVSVFWGDIDRSGATGPHQGKGTMTLDLTALHGVVPTEAAVGTVAASFETTGTSRWLVVDAQGVAWEVDPTMPDGTPMPAPVLSLLEQPRNGHYVYFREPGKGGSLKIQDQMVFLCPANPQLKLGDVTLADRWYLATGGARHGRADGRLTGGQLPDQSPPVDKVVAVTCHQSPDDATMPSETFWLMKEEAADGSTIQGWSSATLPVNAIGSDACDPALNPPKGTVPDLTGPANDFDFSGVTIATNVNLDDPANQPYPFPGM